MKGTELGARYVKAPRETCGKKRGPDGKRNSFSCAAPSPMYAGPNVFILRDHRRSAVLCPPHSPCGLCVCGFPPFPPPPSCVGPAHAPGRAGGRPSVRRETKGRKRKTLTQKESNVRLRSTSRPHLPNGRQGGAEKKKNFTHELARQA